MLMTGGVVYEIVLSTLYGSYSPTMVLTFGKNMDLPKDLWTYLRMYPCTHRKMEICLRKIGNCPRRGEIDPGKIDLP